MAKKAMFEGSLPRLSTTSTGGPRRVAVLAFDGVVLGDLSTASELFGRARLVSGEAAYRVEVCAHKREVRTEQVGLVVPGRLSRLRSADLVVVPGIDDLDRPVEQVVLKNIQDAAGRGARIASICTGAFVLARTGLLDGQRATTHWRVAAELARRFAGIKVEPGVLYVDNGQVLTSAGAAAAFDLCLHIVRNDCGAQVAARLAREAVMPLERAGGQAQFIIHEAPSLGGTTLGPLLDWICENLNQPLTLPALAHQARMSQRTLSRRFSAHTGATPAAWIASARVRRAQELLESTDWSVEQVAGAVGFSSAAILRERFRQGVGTSPQAYRKAFRHVQPGGERAQG